MTPNATTKTPPALGSHWTQQGGIYAGIVRGEVDTNGHRLPDHHLIVAAADDGEIKEVPWGAYGQPEPNALHVNDGLANTQALAASEHSHPPAEWAIDLTLNGFNDWYVPSQAELMLCFANAREHFAQRWHWSSTQYSADSAWFQSFGNGLQYNDGKYCKARARAVRRVVIHSSI